MRISAIMITAEKPLRLRVGYRYFSEAGCSVSTSLYEEYGLMSDQCLGITKSGTRCKISSNLVDGYCRLHRKQAEELPGTPIAETQPEPETDPASSPPSGKKPTEDVAPPPFEEPGEGPELSFDNDTGSLKKLFTVFGIVLVIAAFIFKRKRR
jgi:hypothetical protein